jgi:hypothetical protein
VWEEGHYYLISCKDTYSCHFNKVDLYSMYQQHIYLHVCAQTVLKQMGKTIQYTETKTNLHLYTKSLEVKFIYCSCTPTKISHALTVSRTRVQRKKEQSF